jgi:sugar/nucleoside kinase (ribokinase family)
MPSPYPRAAKPALIVGTVAIDRIATTAGDSGDILGGAATYAAIAASYFTPPRIVSVVGADFPPQHMKKLRKHGIDLAGVEVDPRGKTFYWSGRYGENFNRCENLVTDLNVLETFSPKLPAAYADSRYVMLGAITPALQHQVMDQVPKGAFVLADTRSLWIEITRPDLERLLPRVGLFVLNEDEAEMLAAEKNLIVAGAKIRKMGPRIVIVKKGSHGSLLFHPDGFFALPAYPVTRVIDPTGAGDSYAGALIGYLASVNRTDFAAIKKAIAYATACASLTVESFGVDRLSSAGRKSVVARFEKLQEMTAF